ncbi:uncharacterized protein LOC101455721 [Ceratitis capitata]|uniref:uncharacterized protein LOC101455721 n=1 Tax=Ceratitis capitata TaxID=7213 RepID=UPI00061889A3|nr:uncharacterized protein LOC101455721 [Ceratitis capitata]XP_020718090.1 uncharacterized protein LOC101455721 [Ceratitis capitata]XP_020718091.1 uncharacterized protein LOC101455721 [Ceratitis capitata]
MLPGYFVNNVCSLAIVWLRIIDLAASYLLYPNGTTTVLQITASISVPIAHLPPKRSILWDWGIQMNYELPFFLESFYNVPIWPTDRSNGGRLRRFTEAYQNYFEPLQNNKTLKNWLDETKNRHIFDFTAGELYRALERLIKSHGYHPSCLLQSVCELAKYPFDANHRHIITDILTFLLTPSWHLGFDASEHSQRRAYEAAEKFGIHGRNCKKVYENCRKSWLRDITHVIFDNT